MTAPAVHVFEHRLVSYRRTFRGSLFSSFLQPALFLTAMGVGLGALVNRPGNAALGGVSYLVFLAPGLLAGTAMQTAAFESQLPALLQPIAYVTPLYHGVALARQLSLGTGTVSEAILHGGVLVAFVVVGVVACLITFRQRLVK